MFSRLLRTLPPLNYESEVAAHSKHFFGRRWLIRRIDSWVGCRHRDARNGEGNVLWLTGRIGLGKSALAAWLAQNRSYVAAFHMAAPDDGPKRDTRAAILSIANQLTTQLPVRSATRLCAVCSSIH